MDIARSCYASWMNTPDAGRIRVRWYAIPRPPDGVYELTDYSSSDWDEDPKSYDPPLGEESTTRKPYTDWRPCQPPPFPCPPAFSGGILQDGQQPFYICRVDIPGLPPEWQFLNKTWLWRSDGLDLMNMVNTDLGPNQYAGIVYTDDGERFIVNVAATPVSPGPWAISAISDPGPLNSPRFTIPVNVELTGIDAFAYNLVFEQLCGLPLLTERSRRLLTDDDSFLTC